MPELTEEQHAEIAKTVTAKTIADVIKNSVELTPMQIRYFAKEFMDLEREIDRLGTLKVLLDYAESLD